jgi:hypothetical protein
LLTLPRGRNPPAVSRLPQTVQGGYIAAIVLGALLGCCGGWGAVSAGMQQVMMSQMGDLGAGDPAAASMVELQRITSITGLMLGLGQLAAAAALIVGASIGLSGRRSGRAVTFAGIAGSCLVMLGEIAIAIWNWTVMRSMLDGMLPEQGGAMGGSEIAVITAATLVPSGCWVVLRLGVAIGAAAALLSPESRDHHAHAGPGGAPPGPRGE